MHLWWCLTADKRNGLVEGSWVSRQPRRRRQHTSKRVDLAENAAVMESPNAMTIETCAGWRADALDSGSGGIPEGTVHGKSVAIGAAALEYNTGTERGGIGVSRARHEIKFDGSSLCMVQKSGWGGVEGHLEVELTKLAGAGGWKHGNRMFEATR